MPSLDRVLTNAIRPSDAEAGESLFAGRYTRYGDASLPGRFEIVPDPSGNVPDWGELLDATRVDVGSRSTDDGITPAAVAGATSLRFSAPNISQTITWDITGLTIQEVTFYTDTVYQFSVENAVGTGYGSLGNAEDPTFPGVFEFTLFGLQGPPAVRTFWCQRRDLTPRDIIDLNTSRVDEFTQSVTTVVELEDTVFRVRFDPFWIIGASFLFEDGVEGGSWLVFGISRTGGRARYLDLFCRRQEIN